MGNPLVPITDAPPGARPRQPLLRPRLPDRLADFGHRGFRLDRPAERAVLEKHARSFLAGFNVAAARWASVHDALTSIPAEERGFAYEGAGMYASLRDLAGLRGYGSLTRLLAGAGDGYVHLVHVGTGWIAGSLRLPRAGLPGTPLLRWLALDGAGFAETYFGGHRAMRRVAARRPGRLTAARLAGCGRALWFLESASVDGVADVIANCPEAARPHLWNGIGLAIGYAGGLDGRGVQALARSSGDCSDYLAQGAVFAANARVRSGMVPAHTELVCRELFAADPDEAARWADVAATGIADSPELAAYYEWKARIRKIVRSRP